MIKATYLRETIYFDSLEEACNYYGVYGVKSIDEVNNILTIEYAGMAPPIIE